MNQPVSVRLPATSPCQSAVAMGNAADMKHKRWGTLLVEPGRRPASQFLRLDQMVSDSFFVVVVLKFCVLDLHTQNLPAGFSANWNPAIH